MESNCSILPTGQGLNEVLLLDVTKPQGQARTAKPECNDPILGQPGNLYLKVVERVLVVVVLVQVGDVLSEAARRRKTYVSLYATSKPFLYLSCRSRLTTKGEHWQQSAAVASGPPFFMQARTEVPNAPIFRYGETAARVALSSTFSTMLSSD